MPETIGIIGLGKISEFHVQALNKLTGIVGIITGMDIDPSRSLMFDGKNRAVYDNVEAMLSEMRPNTVIVATPTRNHYKTAQSVILSPNRPNRLIIEKPIAASESETREILEKYSNGFEIATVFHAAHAPEVLWAFNKLNLWKRRFGEIIAYYTSFSDPYSGMNRTTRDRVYVNSWFDSGINALSVALRFVDLRELTSFTCVNAAGSTYEVEVSYRSGSHSGKSVIRTNWNVTEPSKSTTIGFESGAQLYLNHQSIQGSLHDKNTEIDTFSYSGNNSRLLLHYRNSFNSFFVDKYDYYNKEENMLLHHLLFSGEAQS